MITFLLIVESETEECVGDRVLHKECEWHVLPRAGEALVLEGNTHPVMEVDHNFGVGRIEVYVRADNRDFDRLLTFDGYELKFDVATT